MKIKMIALMLSAGGFTLALGLNCIPNIGLSINDLIGTDVTGLLGL